MRRKERLPNEVNAADRGGGERNGMERRNFRNVRMNAGKSMSFFCYFPVYFNKSFFALFLGGKYNVADLCSNIKRSRSTISSEHFSAAQ